MTTGRKATRKNRTSAKWCECGMHRRGVNHNTACPQHRLYEAKKAAQAVKEKGE